MSEQLSMWTFEREYIAEGITPICGIDEAGRGPLAGPVCAACVILPNELIIPGLNDSKKLTDKKRKELYDVIVSEAIAYGIAFADEKEIDSVNILQATFLAMRRAYENMNASAAIALVDGNRDPGLIIPARLIVGGDGKSANIAAASVLAKVTRDRYMEELASEYPEYGFDVHKGYGTKRHYAAIEKFGPTQIHRQSFLKKFYEKKSDNGLLG